jgi:hypothetical protein
MEQTPLPPLYIDPAHIPAQDLLARYADFKHRVWLTWYSMQMYTMEIAARHRLSWLAMIEGTDVHGDLWLWEDGDEERAKALHDTYHEESGHPIPCPTEDLVDAFRALEARTRKSRPPAQNVLAHLSPQVRVAIISWFIVAGPLRQSKLKSGHPRMLKFAAVLGEWATMFHKRIPRLPAHACTRCSISSILPIWVKLMLQIHSVEDLMAIPWPCGCNCLNR